MFTESSTRARSPRDIITPDALQVAPELLGLPLARPWRRAAAMSIDGLLIALLANAPGALFGLAAALVLFRVSARQASGGYMARSFRLMFRLGGALVLFVVVNNGWDSLSDRVSTGTLASMVGEAAAPGPAEQGGGEGGDGVASGREGIRLAAELLAFRQADDPAAARRHAAGVVSSLRAQGEEGDEIGETLLGLAESAPDRPWLRQVADSVARELAAPAPAAKPSLPADSLLLAYAAALRAGEVERAGALRPQLASSLAGDSIARLHARLGELRSERSELRREVETLRERTRRPGFLAMVGGLAEDLGLGFGWAGLYFTATVALFGGRTPGKRLLGIRVIRLNGKPIGWWAAFERFGGYAAGVATGLLGFAQILWDRNRQAIHDKITETAVIRG